MTIGSHYNPTDDTPFSPLSSPVTVLVVDDHPDTLQVMRLILEALGFHVLSATSGTEALQIVNESAPPVILCDLGLPAMDGFALIRAMREQAAKRRILAFALSGHAHPQDRDMALSAGFDAYFVKPLDVNDLLHTIRRLLRERHVTP